MRSARLCLVFLMVGAASLVAACDDGGRSFSERVRERQEQLRSAERLPYEGSRATGFDQGQQRSAFGFGRRTRDRGGRQGGLLAHRADYVVVPSGYRTPRYDFAEGTLHIDLLEECDGWTLQERLAIALSKPAGGVPQSSILYRATELDDQSRLRFAYSRRQPGDDEDVIGEVYRDGRVLFANFSQPEGGEIDLPRETVFPISHLRQLVAAARRGRNSLSGIVFDGANLGPYRAQAAIRAPIRPSEADPRLPDVLRMLGETGPDTLPRGRVFPVNVAYYSLADPAGAPVLEREMLLHESGIIVGMHIDYGDLRMDARLAHLERQSPPDCRMEPVDTAPTDRRAGRGFAPLN